MSLKELKRLWYKKLEESGFEDIESYNNHLKEYHANGLFNALKATEVELENKREYYTMAGRFLDSYAFADELERLVWAIHSEGLGVRVIALDLTRRGYNINKDKANLIIKRLKKCMLSMSAERTQD